MVSLQSWEILIREHTRELNKKLDEIKSINDLKERNTEITCAKGNWGMEGKLGILKNTCPSVSYNYLLDEYEELLNELDKLGGKAAKKSNQEEKVKNNPNNKKIDTLSKKQKQYNCAECGEIKKGKYKYKKNKKDNQKFCSNNCFYTHYAETCDNCLEKCLIYSKDKVTGYAQTYYSDRINKTGTLCSKCHQEQIKEENEQTKKDKELEESCKRLDKNMDNLVDGMVETVKGEDEDLDSSEINDKNSKETKDNNSINNNIIERERERDDFILLPTKQYQIYQTL